MAVPADLDLTEFDYALKDLYDPATVVSAVFKNNPLLARVPKNTKFPGRKFIYAVKYADMTGRSTAFASAQGNRNPSKGVDFQITRAHDYAVGRIDTETMLASEDDEGAFLEATETEADSAINAIKRSLGIRMYGNGSGKIGSVSSPGADPTLTLENSDDITNFEPGQRIVFAADEASALRDSGASLYVGDIDVDAGTFECEDSSGAAANVTAVSGIADGDSIFTQGDYVSAGDRNMVIGLDGWNPKATESVSTSFNGVTRSVYRQRLAGSAYNDTSYPGYGTEEAIHLLISRLNRMGQDPDSCYMGPDRWRGFISSLESRAQYIKETVNIVDKDGSLIARVGFNGIEVSSGDSTVKCFKDFNCPEDRIHVIKNDVLELKSIGQVPRWLTTNRIVEDADQIEFRLGMFGNLRCKNPAALARFDWA
jgi:hypothetical protein